MVEAKCSSQKHLITWSTLLVIYIICLVLTIGRCWDLHPDANITTAVVGHLSCFRLNILVDQPPSLSLSPLMTSTTVKVRLDIAVDFGDGSTAVNYIDHHSSDILFDHIYHDEGCYVVRINATDGLLWKMVDVDVKVISLADLIHLQLPETQVFPVSSEVVAQVHVNNVNDEHSAAEFNWDFGDKAIGRGWPQIVSCNSTHEMVAYRYSTSGTYQLKVTVNSSILCEPVTVVWRTPLIIVEPIDDVHLEMMSSDKIALRRLRNGSSTTDPVKFVARTATGSHMNFTFDFGDGDRLTLNKETNRTVIATHQYTTEGMYSVCVTAANALGNQSYCLSQMVSVERLPEGLRLNRNHYVGRVGETIRLEAHLMTMVNNVSFDWRLGNDVLLLNAGPVVENIFPGVGNYRVSVTAKNAVTTHKNAPTVRGKVSIRDVLQDVELSIIGGNRSALGGHLFSTEDEIELVADVRPSSANKQDLSYLWRWGHKAKQSSRFSTLKHNFTDPGWFILTVTVDNVVSNVTSSALELQVLEKVTANRLLHLHDSSSTFIRGQIVTFIADHSAGSNLTYDWDFGDGTPSMTTAAPLANHTFQRVGEYVVNVLMSNELSVDSANETIFVVNDGEWCDRPLARIVGIKDHAKIEQSEDGDDDDGEGIAIGGRRSKNEGDLRVEAVVDSVDCRHGNRRLSVVYRWSVVYDTDRTRLFTSDRRWLNVFTNQLPIGDHTLHLKVGLNGSIVYNAIKTRFTVVSTPLRASVAGGSGRWVGRSDNVTVGGIVGHYVHRKCRNCFFEWSCSALHHPAAKCFVDQSKYSGLNEKHIETNFMSSWLDQAHHQAFVFTFHLRRGLTEETSASQIIRLDPEQRYVPQIGVSCLTCFEGGFVSKHQRIVFISQCFNCSSNVEFEWQLWLVLDERQNLPISYADCAKPDGSTYYLRGERVQNVSTVMNSEDDRNLNEDVSSMNSTLISLPPGKFSRHFDAAGNSHFSSLNRSTNIYFGPFEGSVNISEGLPGEAGSFAGRRNKFSFDATDRMAYSRRRHTPVSSPKHIDENAKGQRLKRKNKKFGHRDDHKTEWVSLLKHETTTGLFQHQLVVQPGILRAGRTYKVVVKARDQVDGNRLPGKAELMISSLQGPRNGKCNITPRHGVMYWTTFRLICLEWVGEFENYRPLLYELRYSTSPNDDNGSLIRLSLDNQFKFVLPSGLPQDNYSIYLNVIVHQHGGGSTKVCSISKLVRPPIDDNDDDILSLLKYELQNNSSDLHSYSYRDDLSSFLQRTHVIMAIVNDINQRRNDSRLSKSIINRFVMKHLKSLTVFNEEEVLLSLSIIEVIFQTKFKVDFNLLKNIIPVMRRLVNTWSNVGHRPHTVADGITSFSKAINALMFVSTASYRVKVMQLMEKVVSRRLQMMQPTESPWEIKTDSFVITSVCRETKKHSVHLETEWINVRFGALNVTDLNDGGSHVCLIADIILGYSTEMSILTFGLYNRNGFRLPSCLITLKVPIIAVIPRPLNHNRPQVAYGSLTSEAMDVYSFKLTRSTPHQTFMLKIEFDPVLKDLFPVVVYISYGDLPCSGNCLYTKSISSDNHKLIALIPGKYMNRSGLYNIGIVSERYKSRSFKLNKENSAINYTLVAEFVECLQKDSDSKSWNISPVLYELITDDLMIHCSFDKISEYTTSFYQVHLMHSRIDIDFLLRRPINLWVLATLGVIFVVYTAVQLILYRLKTKARQHYCGIRVAENNSPRDEYAYLVTLQTGYAINAGTTAKVCIELIGEDGLSETRRLVSSDETHFVIDAGSTNTFLVTTKPKLGPIWKVNIWHDNSGNSPSLYLSHLIITDVKTGESRHFEFNRWLSVEGEVGNTKHEVVAKPPLIRSLRKIFIDYYLKWYFKLSMWNGSVYDHFSPLERILCNHLVTYASVLGIFLLRVWTLQQTRDDVFGRVDISLQTIVNSILVGTLISGLGIVPALLFQFSKLSFCKFKDTLNIKANSCESIDAFEMDKLGWLQKWAERTPFVESESASSSRYATVSDLSYRTIQHSLGEGVFDLKINELQGVGKGQLGVVVLPAWCRYFTWILCFCCTCTSIICIFYFALRLSIEIFVTLLQLMIISLAFGYAIGFPLLMALFAGVLTLMSTKRRHFSVIGCVCGHQCVNDASNNISDKLNRLGSSSFVDVPPCDRQLSESRTNLLKKRQAFEFLKQLIWKGSVLILLTLLIIGEGNSGLNDANRLIKRKFQRKHPLNVTQNYEEWLSWVTTVVYELPQKPIISSYDQKVRWFADGYDNIIISDFQLCTQIGLNEETDFNNMSTSSCVTLSRKQDVSKRLIANFNETVWRIPLQFTKSQLYICLYNIPTSSLSVITAQVEFENDVIHSSGIHVESMVFPVPWKSYSQIHLWTSISRIILLCLAIQSVRHLFSKVLSEKQNWTHYLRKLIFPCILLVYLGFKVFISNLIYIHTLEIETGEVQVIDMDNLLNYIKVSRGLIGVIYFIHLLHCIDLMSIYWESTIYKSYFVLKCIWKTLLWGGISVLVLVLGFSSLGTLWGSMKSVSFASSTQAAFSLLVLLTTRNFDFESRHNFDYCFDRVYVSVYVFILVVIGYWQIRLLIAALRNGSVDQPRFNSLDFTSLISVLKLEMQRLFRRDNAHANKDGDGPTNPVPMTTVVSLLEAQIEELLKKLERCTQLDSLEGLDLEDSDDVFTDDDDSSDNEPTSMSDSLPQYSDILEDAAICTVNTSDSLSMPVEPAYRFNSTSVHSNGLHRSKTIGKGIYKSDQEMCLLSEVLKTNNILNTE